MKDTVIVYTAACARQLLKLGYTIVDLRPDKKDEDKKRTIFFFKNEEGLEAVIKKMVGKHTYIR